MQSPTEHEHDFRLQLGADGHGQIYGNYEGYVRRCPCGEFAPDYARWKDQREKKLANELYIRVVNPDTIWWDDLPEEMQEGWLRAARWLLTKGVRP